MRLSTFECSWRLPTVTAVYARLELNDEDRGRCWNYVFYPYHLVGLCHLSFDHATWRNRSLQEIFPQLRSKIISIPMGGWMKD
jgi:hypothetical protein